MKHILLVLCLILFLIPISSAQAISEDIILMQVQTGGNGTGTASQEFILLYNSSDNDINITDWCLEYSSSSNGTTFSKLGCVEPTDDGIELWLSADGFTHFATDEFVIENAGFVPDFTFSSGMADSGGHVSIIDDAEIEVDRLGWGGAVEPEGLAADAHIDGELLSRNFLAEELDTDVNMIDFSSQEILSPIVSGLFEQATVVDACTNIPEIQIGIPEGYLLDDDGLCVVDVCQNILGLQVSIPDGYEILPGETGCSTIPLEDSTLYITELLPNSPSFDSGNEFIEIFNPNDISIDLTGYVIELGDSFTKSFTFSSGSIQPGQYITVSDSVSGLVLPNTTGVVVRLLAPAGNVVSMSSAYSSADDDVSWALVSDQWIYTNQITPEEQNKPYLIPAVDEVLGVTSILAPCSAGKFRNPETNRCKSLTTAVTQLVPCSSDQFRNPATNRCNNLSTSSSSSLVPCKEGQERNVDTNRCRNVSVAATTTDGELATVTDISTVSTAGQVNWSVIFLALSGTLGYMVYEWRVELEHRFARFKKA